MNKEHCTFCGGSGSSTAVDAINPDGSVQNPRRAICMVCEGTGRYVKPDEGDGLIRVGDKVEKIGGDYTFVGYIVAEFRKLSRAIRYVVEDDRGVLHIYSDKNLRMVERQ